MQTALGLALLACVAAVVGGMLAARRASTPAPVRCATSPLDQAERILAARYARGRISAEEYQRMTAVLRR